ncbi:MAG TPA: cytochrome c3 family protein [Gammaproteobacteria bacterium]
MGRRYHSVDRRTEPGRRGPWARPLAVALSSLLGLAAAGALHAQVPVDERHGDCLFCHMSDEQSDGSLILPEPEVCWLCHAPGNDHAILIPATTADPSLPLNNGLMTCITCHDPHSTQALQLRLPTTGLCAACHDI